MVLKRVLLSFVASGVILPALATGAAAAAEAAPGAVASTISDGFTTSVTAARPPARGVASTSVDPSGYWTAQKMREAVPADIVVGSADSGTAVSPSDRADLGTAGTASLPVPPRGTAQQPSAPSNATVPSTAGKLFFTINGKPYVCSAATINNAYKNLIETAGHCVHSGRGGGWHANVIFAPAYYNGYGPTGAWSWANARTFNSWISNSDFSHDQASDLPK